MASSTPTRMANLLRKQWRPVRSRRLFSSKSWPKHDHVPIYMVDAFSDVAFHGNPAAVCLLPEDVQPSSRWMQNVAMEMNQAETAFIAPKSKETLFSLRWFTPVAEVDLCGHATLASAQVLYELGYIGKDKTAHFDTRSGILTTSWTESDMIEMEFPYQVVNEITCTRELETIKAVMQDKSKFVGVTPFDFLVELESESEVLNFEPDMAAITKLGRRATIITAKSNEDSPRDLGDYVARVFAPQIGIPEDPVTGSAHCAVGPYWAKKLGKDTVVGYQASKRGGYVKVTPKGERVGLKGAAVMTMKGELNVLVL